MTDSARLRQAAEVLNSMAQFMPPDDGDLDTPADQWVLHCGECRRNAATADLLRAVADYQNVHPLNPFCAYCGSRLDHPHDDDCPWVLAGALADTVFVRDNNVMKQHT